MACPFPSIQVTTAAHEVAVASGDLEKQTWAPNGRRTFHFNQSRAMPPAHVALAIGKISLPPSTAAHWSNLVITNAPCPRVEQTLA